LTLAEAARAAIFELCQVELGLHVIAAKRQESGDAALSENDCRKLRRGAQFDPRNCRLLQPETEDISGEPRYLTTNAHFPPDKSRCATGKSLIDLNPWLSLNQRVPGSSPGAPTKADLSSSHSIERADPMVQVDYALVVE
jgi:hypothetical protein